MTHEQVAELRAAIVAALTAASKHEATQSRRRQEEMWRIFYATTGADVNAGLDSDGGDSGEGEVA